MEQIEIAGLKIGMEFDYKGGKRRVTDTIPNLSQDKDYFVQYSGIWKVMFDTVKQLNAKKILEFGTREGYSTRLFSQALKMTGGKIYTVDMDTPKTPFSEDNIIPIRSMVEDLKWSDPVDILYIDDWHSGYHLYYELNRFARLARIVLLHDIAVSLELRNGMLEWCKDNMMECGINFLNGCGLGWINIERSGLFYETDKGA